MDRRMKSCRRLLGVAALLSVLLVVSAQCFGIGRAFLCACSAELVITEADHCHDAEPCSEGAGACDEDRQAHVAVSEKLMSVAPGSVGAPELVPVLVAILLQHHLLAHAPRMVELRDARWHASRPPPSVAVTRAVEFLI